MCARRGQLLQNSHMTPHRHAIWPYSTFWVVFNLFGDPYRHQINICSKFYLTNRKEMSFPSFSTMCRIVWLRTLEDKLKKRSFERCQNHSPAVLDAMEEITTVKGNTAIWPSTNSSKPKNEQFIRLIGYFKNKCNCFAMRH